MGIRTHLRFIWRGVSVLIAALLIFAMTNCVHSPSIRTDSTTESGITRLLYQNQSSLFPLFAMATALLLVLVLIMMFLMLQRKRREGRTLEQMVKERTIELEFASQAKSNFLANMSHEIRTPMNAIIGMTAIAKTADTIERVMYSIERIEDASNHLLGVINDILDMSKIEANKFELSPTEFEFEKMLKRVVSVINYRVSEKNQGFKVYVDSKIPPYLIGDDQRLAQVITNLLGNAVKFTPDGGSINLNTYLMGETDGICEIKIAVTDTGIGISKEQQATLFHSFTQAESDTARKYGGTGLGLSISKNIVELMNGQIWVTSELGEGSSFVFTFKMKRGSKEQERLPPASLNWEDIRVLVVDDDWHILSDFQGILNLQGITCDVAENGLAALELVERNKQYDVFFIDWRMPAMDGFELVAELKKREKEGSNPLYVMISAAEISSIGDFAHHSGVSILLQKPLFPSSITDIICEHVIPDAKKLKSASNTIDDIYRDRYALLAEDVEINREIVLALLEPTNITIDTAANGVEAVNMFAESSEKYEIVFMDVQMPEMDGYEATRRIRQLALPNAKSIPIVAMTANVFKEDVEKCLAAGMNDHIGKPINIDDVLDVLRKYL